MTVGQIRKLRSKLTSPVEYSLPIGEEFISLNDKIGNHFTLEFTGNIYCIQCQRKTKKSFQQGFCFPCYRRLGECGFCMIHPERCLHGEGSCQSDDWVHASCMQPHIVYFANSSGLKVGITRQSQVPTRWIDQGAIQALAVFAVPSRYLAGIVEVALKQFVADKTNWRALLKGNNGALDLIAERDRLLEESLMAITRIKAEFPTEQIELLSENKVQHIDYPVLNYPTTIKSLDFEKTPTISGILQGIKGQYLIFDNGVINMRKFGGYELAVSSKSS